jgi:hypothetical protein
MDTIRITPEIVAVGVAHCDERIQEIKYEIERRDRCSAVLACLKGKQPSLDYGKLSDYDVTGQREIDYLIDQLKLVQIEKQVLNALTKTNNSALFPKFLSKIDELLATLYEKVEDDVKKGSMEEGKYLAFCKESLGQRNYLKDLCWAGEFQNRTFA